MITNPNMTSIAELNRAAVKALIREIGYVNTGRFLSQYSSEFGNYTEDRDRLLGNPTVEELVAEIYRNRENQAASGE